MVTIVGFIGRLRTVEHVCVPICSLRFCYAVKITNRKKIVGTFMPEKLKNFEIVVGKKLKCIDFKCI